MSSEPANPYSAPVSAPATAASGETRTIIIAWERLRLVYNITLLVVGMAVLAVALLGRMPLAGALAGALVVGVGANVCFFAAPVVELYTVAFWRIGPWPRHRRLMLFGVGLLFSLGIFALVGLGLFAASHAGQP